VNFEDFISDSSEHQRPRKIVLYGTHGIGKSSMAAACPFGPVVFLPTEDGYQDLRPQVKVLTFNKKRVLESESELLQAISILYSSEHPFKTVVLDSAEAAEALIQKQVAMAANKDSIADIGFGKGQAASAVKFQQMLTGFDALNANGMTIIIIAHADVEKFNDPAGDQYDRYTLRLHKAVSPMLQEWADEVLFANYKVYTKTVDEGFGKKTVKALGAGERVVYTTERPTHDAKNRLGLPDEIAMDWSAINAAIGV
jgi:hypothetical protein